MPLAPRVARAHHDRVPIVVVVVGACDREGRRASIRYGDERRELALAEALDFVVEASASPRI